MNIYAKLMVFLKRLDNSRNGQNDTSLEACDWPVVIIKSQLGLPLWLYLRSNVFLPLMRWENPSNSAKTSEKKCGPPQVYV